MYKIIFADIDGTLRNDNREISQRTKDNIKKLQKSGIRVILCSGRPRCEVERVKRECGADRYIICSNGAEVYDTIKKKVEYKNSMDMPSIKEIYAISEKEDCTFVMETGNIRIINRMKYKDGTEMVPINGMVKAAFDHPIMQCVILDKDMDKMKRVREELQKVESVRIINESKYFKDKDKALIKNDSIYCDLVDNATSKGKAVEVIQELLGVDREETIGIGDSYNDLEMLDKVGYSVAMKNAARGLKSKVDEVTENDNNLDGAAEFFEKILNGQIK